MVRSLVLPMIVGLAAATAFPALAEAPRVVASIKPVHSLVAAVMEGVGTPDLIVKGAASPHTYSLKPSDASAIDAAGVVFWVGGTLEPFLGKPLETLASDAVVVELSKAHGLTTLAYRTGGPFEAHVHAGEDHHDHDSEAGEAHGHDHDAAAHGDGQEADEAETHDHAHEGEAREAIDMHLWLDPSNARAWVHEIEEALSRADPANAARYASNAKAVSGRLDDLDREIAARVEPVRGKPFIVFHDAYQYFENRFGLPAAGSITVSPEVAPGAQRVTQMRDKVKELGAVCVFAEPQFEPKIIATIVDGTDARAGVLDPEGAALTDGPDLYFDLLRSLSDSLAGCLSGSS